MNREKLHKKSALRIAKGMKERLLKKGVPVEKVFVFGSVISGNIHPWSDLDVAFVCRPFGTDRIAEYNTIAGSREDFDIPMDIVFLRSEDMENRFSTIVQEVKKNGIEV